MADVLVRHCTIRVVRRGGWSWGAEPRALLDRVMHQVPNLIAAALERLFPDDDDEREIAAPVRLRIPLSLAMLRAGGASEAGLTMPEPAQAAIGWLQVHAEAGGESGLEQLADAYLGGGVPARQAAEAVYVAAALQVYFAQLAASLASGALALLPQRGRCPVCGSAPGALIRGGTRRKAG